MVYCRETFITDIIGSRMWRDLPGDANYAVVREVLETKNPTVIIATDGSIRDSVTAWGGSVWKGGRRVFEWSTAKHGKSSSYRSECEALEDAFTWMSKNTDASESTVILNDSLSVVSKLRTGRVKKAWFPILQSIEGKIEICYIPGHAGIKYNERADWLAGSAKPFGSLDITQADLVHQVSQEIRNDELAESSFSLARLQEEEIEAGVGARATTRGCDRALSTQITVGVMSRNNLRKLLEIFEGGGPVGNPVSALL